MKKIISLVMSLLMLCTVMGGFAEEGRISPLYATVGEAMDDSMENRVIAGGVPEQYFAVVTQKDGKYYRSVAYCDEKLNELNEALNSLDYEAEDFFEKHEAAMQAVEDYMKTLPIAYSEEFTAAPLTDEEMEATIGKTLSQLEEEGFELGSNGTESDENDELIIVYSLRYGVYDYFCEVDADFDQYIEAQENDTQGDLKVKGIKLAGITEWGYDMRFHTDGTVDEPEDPFADMVAILAEFSAMLEKVMAGEEIDIVSFADTLKAQYPDSADMIDFYVMMYQSYGAEGLASILTPAE